MWVRGRWLRGWLCLLAGVMLAAGCASSADPSPSVSVSLTPVVSSVEPSESVTASSTAIPAGQKTDLSAAVRHAKGQAGTVDGVTFTVLASSVQHSSPNTVRRVENHRVKMRLCAGAESVELMSDRWYLVDTQSRVYMAKQDWSQADDPSLGDPTPPYPNLETLPSGQCREGWLVFETPDGTKARQVAYDKISGTDHVWAL